MLEVITAFAALFGTWLAWEEHKRKKEEHESKRQGENPINFTSWQIPVQASPRKQPKQKFFTLINEREKSFVCGLLYWFLWYSLWMTIIIGIFGAIPNASFLGTIFLVLGIFIGRWAQKKIHHWFDP